MAVAGSAQDGPAHEQIRAYLEYFRDMGVYDFYRNGEPAEQESVVLTEAMTQAVATIDPQVLSADHAQPAIAQPALATPVPAEPDIPKLISFNDLPPILLPHAARHRLVDPAAALDQVRADIGDCTRCPLAYAGRHKIVFADGSPKARLMFVGEGPGADEDEQGLPFVGKSGQLLTNMIQAMGLRREEVYIANIVKCRPPANRAPEPVEANTCTQFLVRQMDIVQPEFVVALGATAAMYLLGVKQSLASLRGRWHEVRGARAVITYHPAFLLRDPRQKVEAWKDLQMVMAEMGLVGAKKG